MKQEKTDYIAGRAALKVYAGLNGYSGSLEGKLTPFRSKKDALKQVYAFLLSEVNDFLTKK